MSVVKTSAGKFEIEVSDGYPHWATVRYGGMTLAGLINHKELSGLEYVVSRARQLLRVKVPDDERGEI